mgnify:CR=1 FL=1
MNAVPETIRQANSVMWIAFILIFFFVLIVIPFSWILLAKMVIRIDSKHSLYYFELHRLFRFQVMTEGEQLIIQIKVPFYSWAFDPVEELLKPKADREEKPEKEKEKKSGGRFKVKKGVREIARLIFKLLRSIIHSFRVKRFAVQFDTGNYPLNAQLIPLIAWINRRTAMRYYVNFNARNSVDILITNRLIRIVIPVVKTVIRLYT